MDDLLREFVTETNESLDVVDVDSCVSSRNRTTRKFSINIFRLVHTIKGTCGFLNLPRLEALAHAAETLMGKFRDGMPGARGRHADPCDHRPHQGNARRARARAAEPDGADADLIADLERMLDAIRRHAERRRKQAVGTLVQQVLERPLRPGEDIARRPRARISRVDRRSSASRQLRKPTPARSGAEDDDGRQDRQPVDPRPLSTRSNN